MAPAYRTRPSARATVNSGSTDPDSPHSSPVDYDCRLQVEMARMRYVPVSLGDPQGLEMARYLLATDKPVAYLQTLTCGDKPAPVPEGPRADAAGIQATTTAMLKAVAGVPFALYLYNPEKDNFYSAVGLQHYGPNRANRPLITAAAKR